MSKAVVFDEYGGPEVLHLIDLPVPQPAAGEVRVRVKAAGVQPFDCTFRRGGAAQWMPAHFPQRLGNDFAGVVEAVGEGVSAFAVGDEVLGWTQFNGYGEHIAVSVEQIVAKPPAMTWAQAGSLSASGQTAATALKALAVGAGDTFLIHAAAGGVGSMAVQLAKLKGATVIGTASPANHEYLRSLGAIAVAYGEGLTERLRQVAPQGVDVSLDGSGTLEALQASVDVARDRGRIGTIAYQPAADKLGVRRLSSERSVAQLGELARSAGEGQLQVYVQQEFPLAQAAEAHRLSETGHVRGKLALVA